MRSGESFCFYFSVSPFEFDRDATESFRSSSWVLEKSWYRRTPGSWARGTTPPRPPPGPDRASPWLDQASEEARPACSKPSPLCMQQPGQIEKAP